MNTTKIIEEITKKDFYELIEKYSSNIKIFSHAFEHINKAQRNVYNEIRGEPLIIPFRFASSLSLLGVDVSPLIDE